MKRQVIDTRVALLDAAVRVMGVQGYNGTTVDDMCRVAGVTKGAFFHHFGSKEELAVAALERFAEERQGRLAQAGYKARLDPKERVLGYVETRRAMLGDEVADMACLMGTLAGEVHMTHPALREVCGRLLLAEAEALEGDLKAAKALYAPRADWEVKTTAAHVLAVVQGAFVMAKATGDVRVAEESLRHLYRYVNCLLPRVAV